MSEKGGLAEALEFGQLMLSDRALGYIIFNTPDFAPGGANHCLEELKNSRQASDWALIEWDTGEERPLAQLRESIIDAGQRLSRWLWVKNLFRRALEVVSKLPLPIQYDHGKTVVFPLPLTGYLHISESKDLKKRFDETSKAAQKAGKEGLFICAPNMHKVEENQALTVFKKIADLNKCEYPTKLFGSSNVEGLSTLREMGAYCRQVRPFSPPEMRSVMQEELEKSGDISPGTFETIARLSGGRVGVASEILGQARWAALKNRHSSIRLADIKKGLFAQIQNDSESFDEILRTCSPESKRLLQSLAHGNSLEQGADLRKASRESKLSGGPLMDAYMSLVGSGVLYDIYPGIRVDFTDQRLAVYLRYLKEIRGVTETKGSRFSRRNRTSESGGREPGAVTTTTTCLERAWEPLGRELEGAQADLPPQTSRLDNRPVEQLRAIVSSVRGLQDRLGLTTDSKQQAERTGVDAADHRERLAREQNRRTGPTR